MITFRPWRFGLVNVLEKVVRSEKLLLEVVEIDNLSGGNPFGTKNSWFGLLRKQKQLARKELNREILY